jgi:hypothetical protein
MCPLRGRESGRSPALRCDDQPAAIAAQDHNGIIAHPPGTGIACRIDGYLRRPPRCRQSLRRLRLHRWPGYLACIFIHCDRARKCAFMPRIERRGYALAAKWLSAAVRSSSLPTSMEVLRIPASVCLSNLSTNTLPPRNSRIPVSLR